jgi:hypothetical protein
MPGDLYSFSIIYFLGILLLTISLVINYNKILYVALLLISTFEPNKNILLAISYGITGLIIGKLLIKYSLNDLRKYSFWDHGIIILVLIFLLIIYIVHYNFFKINYIFFDILINLINILLLLFIPCYLLMFINNKIIINNIAIIGKYTLIS